MYLTFDHIRSFVTLNTPHLFHYINETDVYGKVLLMIFIFPCKLKHYNLYPLKSYPNWIKIWQNEDCRWILFLNQKKKKKMSHLKKL